MLDFGQFVTQTLLLLLLLLASGSGGNSLITPEVERAVLEFSNEILVLTRTMPPGVLMSVNITSGQAVVTYGRAAPISLLMQTLHEDDGPPNTILPMAIPKYYK